MKRLSLLIAGVLIFLAGACSPAAPVEPESVTPLRPTVTDTPESMSPSTGEPQSSGPSTSLVTPTITCETHTASVTLAASAENLKVGDTMAVSVTLNNSGCTALGLPQYRLYIEPDGSESILSPDKPEPITHNLGVAREQSDTAEFDLLAVAEGQASITASVSFEVHLGFPGPAYWGSSTGESLHITVAP